MDMSEFYTMNKQYKYLMNCPNSTREKGQSSYDTITTHKYEHNMLFTQMNKVQEYDKPHIPEKLSRSNGNTPWVIVGH